MGGADDGASDVRPQPAPSLRPLAQARWHVRADPVRQRHRGPPRVPRRPGPLQAQEGGGMNDAADVIYNGLRTLRHVTRAETPMGDNEAWLRARIEALAERHLEFL